MDAIVGLAFGILPDGSPGESNYKIAQIINKKVREDYRQIFVDKEISLAIHGRRKVHFTTSGHPFDKEYRDTEASVKQIAEAMHTRGIDQVLLIAHPFLHRFKARRIFKKYGFNVQVIPVSEFENWWIPFCKGSAQWWTRGPMRLLIYAVLQALTERKGR